MIFVGAYIFDRFLVKWRIVGESLKTESRHDANFVVTGRTNDHKIDIMTTLGLHFNWLIFLMDHLLLINY